MNKQTSFWPELRVTPRERYTTLKVKEKNWRTWGKTWES